MSNPDMFKYEWIWEKATGSNFATVKYMPMKEHENILVFGKEKLKYNPQLQQRKGSGLKRILLPYKTNSTSKGEVYGNIDKNNSEKEYKELRCPSTVQYFNNREDSRGLHPTQKPVALGQYLIRTYTNEGDLMLDNTCGSGSFLVAAKQLHRNFIGIEISSEYCKIANQRLAQKALF